MADVAQPLLRALLHADGVRLRRYLRSKYGYVPLTWFLEPAWLAVLLHRLSHRAFRQGRQRGARLWMQLNSLLTGADIQPASDLGPGLLIPSPAGVTLSCKAGRNLTVLALAGLGGNIPVKDVGAGPGLPLLGDDVQVGQFTGIQGAIVIGDRALFLAGAGAIVNVPADARMVPAVEPHPGPPPPPPPPHAPPPPCGHAAWRRVGEDWRADVARSQREMMRLAPPGAAAPRPLGVMLTNPLAALWVYRASHCLHCRGHTRLAGVLGGLNALLHKLTIPPATCLAGGVLLPHLAGVLVVGRAGRNVAIFANAVCAPSDAACAIAQAPVLGDDVMIGGHSGAFGPVTLGERVQVGPKTQVVLDVAADMQVFDPHSRGTTDTPPPPAGPAGPVEAAAMPAPGGAGRAASVRPASFRPASFRPASFRTAWAAFGEDRTRWRRSGPSRPPAFPALVCAALFRLSHACHAAGWRRGARWCCLANLGLTGADITPMTRIGGGMLIPYPASVALHGQAGRDLTVLAGAGFGALLRDDALAPLAGAPRLGDGVRIGHHSGVFGAVAVGDGASLPPGGILNHAVPAGAHLLPRPLRLRDRRRVEQVRARARAARGDAAG